MRRRVLEQRLAPRGAGRAQAEGGQLGQFQRHVVRDGGNHLGGRRAESDVGFKGRATPCKERKTGLGCANVSFRQDQRPGEQEEQGQLGQFQRHMVGGGVNHLGGRRGMVGCGFSCPRDPCGEEYSFRLDSVVFWWCFGGETGWGRGVIVSTLEGRRWSEPPCWVKQRAWPGRWPAQS